MTKKWSGANMRCDKCNKYLPDRCTCAGKSIEQKRIESFPPMAIQKIHPETVEEHIKRWDAGETVTSISMAGEDMGSAYEHAIQEAAIMFMRLLVETKFDLYEPDGDKLVERWEGIEQRVLENQEFAAMTGAMIRGAKNLAANFYNRGPAKSMADEAVLRRHITVSKQNKLIHWLK